MQKHQSTKGGIYFLLLLSCLALACKSKNRDASSADSDSVVNTTADTKAPVAAADSSVPAASAKDSVTGEAVAPATGDAARKADSKALPTEKADAKATTPAKVATKKTTAKTAVKHQDGPATSIDAEGFTLLNGRRFFPIGIYTGKGPKQGTWATSDDNLAKIASAGFNTILPYTYGPRPDGPAFMSRAAANGLKVIYSLTDMYSKNGTNVAGVSADASKYVAAVKDSPNLLAWYINDELEADKLPAVSAMYNTVRGEDNQHIIYQVNSQVAKLSPFTQTTDVFGTDPYLIDGSKRSFRQIKSFTQGAKQVAGNRKGLWQVVQMHDKSFHKSTSPAHAPTLLEMRNVANQSLINGSTGLMFYAYHWLFYGRDGKGKAIYSEDQFNKRWPDVVKVVQEVKDIAPVILDNNVTNVKAQGLADVEYKAWKSGGKIYLLMANSEQQTAQTVIMLPEGNWSVASNKNISLASASGNKLNVTLGALESGLIILKK